MNSKSVLRRKAAQREELRGRVGRPKEPSPYPTTSLFHVSDAHGKHGVLPNFAAGETWDRLHLALHDDQDFGGREPHGH